MSRVDEILKRIWYMGNRHDRKRDVAQAKKELRELIEGLKKPEMDLEFRSEIVNYNDAIDKVLELFK